MPLVSLNEVTWKALKGHYAVPGFNIHTYEDAKAIIEGAEEMNSPVILMVAGATIEHMGVKLSAQIIADLAEETKIPVVAHLDHASDMNLIFRAMKYGFTSVMYDGSMLPIDENIANTRKVIMVAKALGINVEAEIGRVGRTEEGIEEVGEILTEPEAAVNFVEKTNVDALAVAVGTCHAMQKQEANIHMDLVRKISEVVKIPLVLHGSSGAKDKDLVEISKTGFSKINIGTRLKTVYVNEIRRILSEEPDLKDQLKLLDEARKAVRQTVIEKIKLLGSANKAF